jgi:hypothetical protein
MGGGSLIEISLIDDIVNRGTAILVLLKAGSYNVRGLMISSDRIFVPDVIKVLKLVSII